MQNSQFYFWIILWNQSHRNTTSDKGILIKLSEDVLTTRYVQKSYYRFGRIGFPEAIHFIFNPRSSSPLAGFSQHS